MARYFLVAIILFVCLAQCHGVTLDQFRRSALSEFNDFRAGLGMSTARLDSDLTGAAQKRANLWAKTGRYENTNIYVNGKYAWQLMHLAFGSDEKVKDMMNGMMEGSTRATSTMTKEGLSKFGVGKAEGRVKGHDAFITVMLFQ